MILWPDMTWYTRRCISFLPCHSTNGARLIHDGPALCAIRWCHQFRSQDQDPVRHLPVDCQENLRCWEQTYELEICPQTITNLQPTTPVLSYQEVEAETIRGTVRALMKRSPFRVTTLDAQICWAPLCSPLSISVETASAQTTSAKNLALLSRYRSCCPLRGANCWMLLWMCFLSSAASAG